MDKRPEDDVTDLGQILSLEKNTHDKVDATNKGTLKTSSGAEGKHGLASEKKDILDDINW